MSTSYGVFEAKEAMADELAEVVYKIRVAQAPGEMTTKVIAVDGPGGAGKSYLAERLSKELGDTPIVRTDDFASWDNPLNWCPRLVDQVLEPLSRNKVARYQRYDWDTKSLAEWHDVEPGEFLILDGVSASREAFRPYLAFSIWVETPRDERLRRGLERDGEQARDQWQEWMRQEDDYIEREHPEQRVDVVIHS